MEQATYSRPSGIPRPSKLPVPKQSARAISSRENLRSPPASLVSPRLRASALRDQLSSSTAQRTSRVPSTPLRPRGSASLLRGRDTSTGTVVHTPLSSQGSRRSTPRLSSGKSPMHEAAEGDLEIDSNDEDTLIAEDIPRIPRPPRPSLSERTVETLQNIPSSPAVRRRGSSFFNNEHQSRSPTRSLSSRPSSSAGPPNSFPVDFGVLIRSQKPSQRPSEGQTPLKRVSIPKPLKTPASTQKAIGPQSRTTAKVDTADASQDQPSPSFLKAGSRSVASRPLKPRASMNALFRKSSAPVKKPAEELDNVGPISKKRSPVFSDSSSSNASEAKTARSKDSDAVTLSSASSENGQNQTPRKSSLALRDQIAKAKAAKRAIAAKQIPGSACHQEIPVVPSDSFDFGLSNDDPFNLKPKDDGLKGLLRRRIATARMDGRLNISGMGLTEIPDEVMSMYTLESIGVKDGSWAEAVDLTRFSAADNDLKVLSDAVFPDIDPRQYLEEDEPTGNQFGGLQVLDLHGNLLSGLPVGLRRLELLTTLNLSHNKLGNHCLPIISQISSLRDLHIAGNQLTGQLDQSITLLSSLEELDLRQNHVSSLPDSLSELSSLRVLNIADNEFRSLPFKSLRKMPVTQLLAARNKLSGTLIADDVDELPRLQILDVTSNALTALHGTGQISLPALHQLSCSSNRLASLPTVATWKSLLTISAEDNRISRIPEALYTLPRVRMIDLSGNDIKVLDDEIGDMESLEIFRISGNPLRDRKFAGMSTEELKRALQARLKPIEVDVDKDRDVDGEFYSAPVSPASPRQDAQPRISGWTVQSSGFLDRSNTNSYFLDPVAIASVAEAHQIRILALHHNIFKDIPITITYFAQTLTTLSLNHNEITGNDFIEDTLELPALKDLNLSSNTITSLELLMRRLRAPLLERMDVSFNRLTSLPILRTYFPALSIFMASHNVIEELLPESIKGLRVVDVSNNDINSLNARIGLLGGPGGLEQLDVSGNRFRVPKYTVLERGTEATLTWLRDKIPHVEEHSSSDQGLE